MMSEVLEILAVGAGVFLARLLQNTIGTTRDILVMRGQRSKAAVLSFLETAIWFITFGMVFRNVLDSPTSFRGIVYFLAFAGGFALGSYYGVNVEERMALGYVAMQVIPVRGSGKVRRALLKAGFPMTVIRGEGRYAHRTIYYSVIPRRSVQNFLRVVKEADPEAFITITDTRGVIRKGRVRA